MVARDKTIIASSIEPSGVTWLINCLLYLDVMCYRDGLPENTWSMSNKKYHLKPGHDELKRWLPALSNRTHFNFFSQVECEWTHNLPHGYLIAEKVILFTRDPRGSILSRYRRDFADIPIKKFIRLLDPATLLTVPDQLNHFYLSWMKQQDVLVIRFEDYKLNPIETLKKATSYLGLNFSYEELNLACINSTFEKAAEVEKKYIQENHLSPNRMMNRAGSAREWIEDVDLSSVREVIENACFPSLVKLKYINSPAPKVFGDNLFSNSCLASIGIRDVLFQSCYTKENKLKIIRGLSNLPFLDIKKRLYFSLVCSTFNLILVLEEKLKVNYLQLKHNVLRN
jgi:hypothetical protein